MWPLGNLFSHFLTAEKSIGPKVCSTMPNQCEHLFCPGESIAWLVIFGASSFLFVCSIYMWEYDARLLFPALFLCAVRRRRIFSFCVEHYIQGERREIPREGSQVAVNAVPFQIGVCDIHCFRPVGSQKVNAARNSTEFCSISRGIFSSRWAQDTLCWN